jgi:hypothetical protein
MANYSLSMRAGQTEFDITEGTDAPTHGDIELTINVAAIPDNTGGGAHAPNIEVVKALRMFENIICGKSKVIS